MNKMNKWINKWMTCHGLKHTGFRITTTTYQNILPCWNISANYLIFLGLHLWTTFCNSHHGVFKRSGDRDGLWKTLIFCPHNHQFIPTIFYKSILAEVICFLLKIFFRIQAQHQSYVWSVMSGPNIRQLILYFISIAWIVQEPTILCWKLFRINRGNVI